MGDERKRFADEGDPAQAQANRIGEASVIAGESHAIQDSRRADSAKAGDLPKRGNEG